MSRPDRPTRAELDAAAGRTVEDLVAPGLDVLFCGINPGLWSAAVGHHFARPGNRFWRVLHLAGFTDTVLEPAEERRLLACGVGVTNLVRRSTANAAELGRDELRAGAVEVAETAGRFAPRAVGFLGVTAYRIAFDRPRAGLGEQPEGLAGTRVWVLPNPSGAQARYQLGDLVTLFSALRTAIPRGTGTAG